MTDTEAPEAREIITRDDQGRPQALATLAPGQMAQFLPKSVSELAVVAKFAAQAHLFGVPDQVTALNIMLAGAHLGLTPYAALEGITLIKGRPVVSAQVQWTLILARGQVEEYSVDSDDKVCEITVTSRKWREPKTQRVTIEDVPKHLFQKTERGADPNWVKFPADMLFAYCIRKLRKRYFPEVMVGALDNGDVESIEGRATVVEGSVVDVGAVEEHVGAVATPPCPKRIPLGPGAVTDAEHVDCGKPTELVPGRSGGMFLRCTEGHMMPPPQAVRDAIRGHREGTAAIQQDMQALHNAPNEEASHEGVEGAVAAVAVESPETQAAPGDAAGGVHPQGAAPDRGAPEPPVGATLPLGAAQDAAFAEAAGIAPEAAQEEPRPMTRLEVDDAVQAILKALTHARAVGKLEPARTILRAHGWDDSPLTSWLHRHPAELPGLVAAFGEPAE